MEAINNIHQFDKFGSILGLERVSGLMEKLGNPQDELKIIHVAGTNGKGSTCRYMYEVLEESGYKVGLYTSPFLEIFNERIEFDRKYISDEELDFYSSKVIEKANELVAEGKNSPTEFDVVTAIAFLYFKEKGADYVILEVGLGGRGDSTNVIASPLVTCITSVSLDHTDRLGKTISQIAWEKAGIIKTGIPVLSAVRSQEAKEVIEKEAEMLDAPFIDIARISYRIENTDILGTSFTLKDAGKISELEISMDGEHQVQNAVLAYFVLRELEKQDNILIENSALRKGFKNARQPGRFEILKKNPYMVIDGAHNPDGARALEETMEMLFGGKKILVVTGILADKDVESILDSFVKIGDEFIATEPVNDRKLACEALAEKISNRGGKCTCCANPEDAVRLAESMSESFDVVLYAGSLYLIGEIRRLINGN